MTTSTIERVTRLLSELVSCPSVNPAKRKDLEPPFGEGRLAELLHGKLSGWGATVRLAEVRPGRPNVIAHWAGKDRARSLMFEAHGDTVAVDGMSIEPFTPKVEDGKLFGRGACDTKGPMAGMLLAIRRVLDEDGAPPTDLYFVSTCDEEHGGRGAYRLMSDGFRADAAVVGEPTELSITWIHKGVIRWRLRTEGKAAHTATPEAGVNAIYHMATALERIRGPMTERLKTVRHPVLGHPTMTVGTIRGGSQVNIVPAECAIEIDRRMLPTEDGAALKDELVREMESLHQAIEGFRFSVEDIEYYPPFERRQDSALARHVALACEKCLGQAEFTAAPYATNAGIFEGAGIPSLVFGPGSAQQAHKAVEYVELEQVARSVEVYAEIIRTAGA